MSEKINDIYHKKMLYLSAGKSLLSDNFLYYKPLVDIKAIDKISKTINECSTLNNKVSLYDKIGAAADFLIRKIIYCNNTNSDIFYFEDDDFLPTKLKAVYIPNTNFFIFNIRHNTYTNYTVDLNYFYYPPFDRRSTTIDDYIEISDYFFDYYSKY